VTDPFGRAIRDFQRDECDDTLWRVVGTDRREHPIEAFYFGGFDPSEDLAAWTDRHLEGPLVDLGAGAGRHALYYQDHVETVALERSAHLVETMRARGVADAREGDMFALREQFDRDRFRSALAVGTQSTLATSRIALREFLGDLAHVTDPDATAVLDGYDPRHPETKALAGYRGDPAPGLGYRTFRFEYAGEVGDTLLFRYVSPDRFRRAVAGTGWRVREVRGGAPGAVQYRVALEKR
jgi:hypothetical protein